MAQPSAIVQVELKHFRIEINNVLYSHITGMKRKGNDTTTKVGNDGVKVSPQEQVVLHPRHKAG